MTDAIAISDTAGKLAGIEVMAIELVGTLMVRDLCRSIDVFRLSHELFNANSGRYLATEVAPVRIKAEAALRAEAEEAGRSTACIDLASIYARVGDLLLLDPATTANLMASELDAERRLLRVDPAMGNLVEDASDRGIEVVGVGDTPLPAALLAEVLTGSGLHTVGDVLVSSASGRSITESAAWADLSSRFEGKRLVFVGSDPLAGAAVEQHGVAVCLVNDAMEEFRHQRGRGAALNGDIAFRHLGADGTMLKNLHRSLLHGLAARRAIDVRAGDALPGAGSDRDVLDSMAETASVIGFGALGPLMTAFAQWVHRAATRAGCGRLRFSESDSGLLAAAYRAWWGDESLPSDPNVALPSVASNDNPVGTAAPVGDDDQEWGARIADVITGWNPVVRRWDAAFQPSTDVDQGSAVLCFAVNGHRIEASPAAEVHGFVDGRIEGEASLFGDLVERSQGFLERCLGAPSFPDLVAGTPGVTGIDDVDVIAVLRSAALEYVVAFRELTRGMPSTVSIVDPHTACDAMAAALGSPAPATAALVARVRRAAEPSGAA